VAPCCPRRRGPEQNPARAVLISIPPQGCFTGVRPHASLESHPAASPRSAPVHSAGCRRVGADWLRRDITQDTRGDRHPACRDFDKAWTYTQPAYRAIVKQADYRKSFGVAGQWRGVQVHGVECEAERCKARIRLTTRVLIPDFKRQDVVGIVDETWVRVDGSWWYYQNF